MKDRRVILKAYFKAKTSEISITQVCLEENHFLGLPYPSAYEKGNDRQDYCLALITALTELELAERNG
jgi:hypothetical protein